MPDDPKTATEDAARPAAPEEAPPESPAVAAPEPAAPKVTFDDCPICFKQHPVGPCVHCGFEPSEASEN